LRRRLACTLALLACCTADGESPSRAPANDRAPAHDVTPATGPIPPPEPTPEPTPEPAVEQPHLRDIDCVYLQPLGDVSAETTAIVREALATTYGVELRTGPYRELPDDAYYEPRRRYRAEKLLDHLDTWLPADCDRIVGITRKDISTTKGKHEDWGILGLGQVPGSSCVVSSFRVRKQLHDVPADERLARVAIHELGHTLGLPHCPNLGCLMEDAEGSVVTIDRETHLCERCLRKIGWRGDPPPSRPSFE
jgi:archaemetzincin